MSNSDRPIRHTLRILQLIQYLESAKRPHSWHELADHFRVSTRTMRRDVGLLERLGAYVPIRVVNGSDGPAKAQVGPLTWL